MPCCMIRSSFGAFCVDGREKRRHLLFDHLLELHLVLLADFALRIVTMEEPSEGHVIGMDEVELGCRHEADRELDARLE